MVVHPKPRDIQSPTDQRLLRSLLKRSGYATSDLEAEDGPDQVREYLMIGRINKAMIMRKDYPSSQRQIAFALDLDLSRWENEGGSFCDADTADMVKVEADDGDIR